jgi:hypothetical protein
MQLAMFNFGEIANVNMEVCLTQSSRRQDARLPISQAKELW